MSTLHLILLTVFIISNLEAQEQQPSYNFRSVFKTPKDPPKRNYDDFEILERASFHSESSPPDTTKETSPKATASAQIHVRIADKRSTKEGEPKKPADDVDDTLKKLLIMLIKPLVENNNAAGRINPFFPFPPSPHPSPPYSHLLGGLSALSALSGLSSDPEALKKAAKRFHKLKEQLRASSVENEVEEKKKEAETIPLQITLNDKPLKLQAESLEENASVAEEVVKKSEKLLDLARLYPLLTKDDDDEDKPKRKKKKPKIKALDPLEVYMRRVSTPGVCNCNSPTCQCNALNPLSCNCNNNLLNQLLPVRPFDLNSIFAPKLPVNPLLGAGRVYNPLAVLPQPVPARPEVLATEFVVHVPVLIKNKPPPYNHLGNYPLLSSLLANYGKCVGSVL